MKILNNLLKHIDIFNIAQNTQHRTEQQLTLNKAVVIKSRNKYIDNATNFYNRVRKAHDYL